MDQGAVRVSDAQPNRFVVGWAKKRPRPPISIEGLEACRALFGV